MKTETKKRIQISVTIVLNFVTIGLVLAGVLGFFIPLGDDGFMAVTGVTCFRYFTVDSNVFLAITSAISLPFLGYCLFKPDKKMPEWVSILFFLGNASTMVTFMTVLLFLGPTQGFSLMYAGTSLYLHALAPIFGLLSYFISPRNMRFSFAWMGVLPVILYGAIYLTMVVFITEFHGGWNDFYGFNVGGMWPISLLIMLLATLLLSYILFFLRKITSLLPFVEE